MAEKHLHRVYNDYRVNNEFFELPLEQLKDLENRVIGLKTSHLSQLYFELILSV